MFKSRFIGCLCGLSVLLGAASVCGGPFHARKPVSKVGFIGDATARKVQGDVEWRVGAGPWQKLAVGSHLPEGAAIRTGDNGFSILGMNQSGSLVKLPPRTIAQLRGIEAARDVSSLTGRESQEGFTIRAIRGQAQIMEQGAWKILKVNSFVKEGRAIRTGANSTIDLFSNESGIIIRLMPSSVLVLDPTPILQAGDFLSNNQQFAARVIRKGALDSSRTVAAAIP